MFIDVTKARELQNHVDRKIGWRWMGVGGKWVREKPLPGVITPTRQSREDFCGAGIYSTKKKKKKKKTERKGRMLQVENMIQQEERQ